MSFIDIPRAEHDFMHVSAESNVLLTFWFLKDERAITTFAYLIGDDTYSSLYRRFSPSD